MKKLPRHSGYHDFGAGHVFRWEDTGYCLAADAHDDGEPVPQREEGSDLCAACARRERELGQIEPDRALEAREKFKSHLAFRAWFREETKGDLLLGSIILAEFAMNADFNDRDNIVWLLLDATGDRYYDQKTFMKAAGIALDTPDTEEK